MATVEAEDVPLEQCATEDEQVKNEWVGEAEEDMEDGAEEAKVECKVQMKPIDDNAGYGDVEEDEYQGEEEYNEEEEEYNEEEEEGNEEQDEQEGNQGGEQECNEEEQYNEEQYEEEYVEQDGDHIYDEEEEEDERVQIHDDQDVINFNNSQEDDMINFEDEEEEKQAAEERGEEEFSKLKVTEEVEETEVKEKEEEYPEEEQLTAEEKHIEFLALDALQRAIDEERYSLRKLRSVISYQSEDIERVRRRITEYTKDAQDSKAIEYMEKLKVLKKERAKAEEERKVANDGLTVIKNQREDKIKELKKKGIKIDTRRSAYMIENTVLKELMTETRKVLTKYNSFAVLKYSFEELEAVIQHVSNVCDDIDELLVKEDLRPHYVSKLNTKERRVGVLYDKLIKWKSYKVENPDIRPTDYESFLYDPEDPFSEDEEPERERSERRESAPRAMRAVRGDTPPRRSDKSSSRSVVLNHSSRSPIRAPVRTSPVRPATRPPRTSPPLPPARATLVRRSIRGSITETASTRSMIPERPRRAERGGDSPPRRAPVGLKRGPPPHRSPPMESKRPASRPPMRVEPRRPSPPRRERPIVTARPRERPLSGARSPRRDRPALLTTPPVRSKPRESSYERRQRMRRSPSPGAGSYRGRERENFQISVKNEGYKRDAFEERPVRRDDRGGDMRGARRPDLNRTERPVMSSRKDTYREAREQRPVVRPTSPTPARRSEIGGSRGHATSYRGSSMGAYRPRR